MVRWVVGSILHGVDPLSYFSFQPVLHRAGRGMYYHVCGMMHITEPLLLIGKSSPCVGSGFPHSLSEWSFTKCPTLYNRKQNVLSPSLNNTFPSFLIAVGKKNIYNTRGSCPRWCVSNVPTWTRSCMPFFTAH